MYPLSARRNKCVFMQRGRCGVGVLGGHTGVWLMSVCRDWFPTMPVCVCVCVRACVLLRCSYFSPYVAYKTDHQRCLVSCSKPAILSWQHSAAAVCLAGCFWTPYSLWEVGNNLCNKSNNQKWISVHPSPIHYPPPLPAPYFSSIEKICLLRIRSQSQNIKKHRFPAICCNFNCNLQRPNMKCRLCWFHVVCGHLLTSPASATRRKPITVFSREAVINFHAIIYSAEPESTEDDC